MGDPHGDNTFFLKVCKLVVEVQKEFYYFHLHRLATWLKDKFYFWFGLQSGCGGPNFFYSFHLHGRGICT
jgi:hypothetical protein